MRSHRLDRLALLTQGVALIGLGMSEVACGKDSPRPTDPKSEDLHINAPPTPTASATPPVDDPSRLPSVNATATPSASSTSPIPRPPIHTNSTPRTPPPKP